MIKVLKQALDALEFFNETAICSADTDISNDAITSLRQAIAELESEKPVGWMKPHEKCDRACMYLCTKGFTQFPECATTHPPQRTEQEQPLPPVEIGVDVTADGASVVAFYRRSNAVMEMFYSQFHPAPQRTEQNFCPRCGKQTKEIHTCTPPQENT